MADLWRRHCLPAIGYPFATFALESLDFEQFESKWLSLVATFEKCHKCVDVEFTTQLLKLAPTWTSAEDNEKREFYKLVQNILSDLTVFAPISTEAVENKHGIVQTTFHKFRGRSKSIHVAVEESILESAVREHKSLKTQIAALELPRKLHTRLSKVGIRHRAHYSKPLGLFNPNPQQKDKKSRRKIRQLSGSDLEDCQSDRYR
jgi:hypothetical protein